MSWTHRVGRSAISPELQQVRAAAQDLAQQAGHAPGKSRVIFQTVADCALIGTAVIGAALASVHLWKSLFPRHKEQSQGPLTRIGGDRHDLKDVSSGHHRAR
jgi:hypothetical protein